MSETLIETAIIAGAVVLGLLILVGLPVLLGIRHSQRQRELEHIERMKALELGRTLPGEIEPGSSEQTASVSAPGKSIAVAVPLGALGIAWLASSTPWSAGLAGTMIWGSAAVVGVAGVICGTILILRSQPALPQPQYMHHDQKPAHDPDTYDVASRRG
jgi:hypothetical protein